MMAFKDRGRPGAHCLSRCRPFGPSPACPGERLKHNAVLASPATSVTHDFQAQVGVGVLAFVRARIAVEHGVSEHDQLQQVLVFLFVKLIFIA